MVLLVIARPDALLMFELQRLAEVIPELGALGLVEHDLHRSGACAAKARGLPGTG